MRNTSILILAILLAPLAIAQGVVPDQVCPTTTLGGVCLKDVATGTTCEQVGSSGSGHTVIALRVFTRDVVWAGAQDACWHHPWNQGDVRVISAGAGTQDANARVEWASFDVRGQGATSLCFTRTDVTVGTITNHGEWGCPLGTPPAVGWGRLLP